MNTINYTEDKENQVGILLINRPKQLNALNSQVIIELNKQLVLLQKKQDIRSIIITGAGQKSFVAGADIKEFQNFNMKQGKKLSHFGKMKIFDLIANYNKPIISAINGYALGGGLELALATHIRIASDTAKLGFPECSLGLIPGYGGTQRLPKVIGVNRAMEMILTAKMISADEAYRIGLVNRVVSLDELIPSCLAISKLFINTSPDSLESAIKSVNASYSNNGDSLESDEFGKLFKTINFQEGVRAFLEKRKPNFNK